MTSSPVLRLPRSPVGAGGFYPAGDERITRRQELPPVGYVEFTEVRVPPAGFRVVDIEIVRCRVPLRNHSPIVVRLGAAAQRHPNAVEALVARHVLAHMTERVRADTERLMVGLVGGDTERLSLRVAGLEHGAGSQRHPFR